MMLTRSWHTTMEPLDHCDDTTGVRFGSPTLSQHDLAGLMANYSPPINKFVVAMPSQQKVLDVSLWDRCQAGSSVQVGEYNGQGAQIFRLMPIKDSGGYVESNQIVLDHCSSTLAVDALSDRCDDGTNVQVVQARNVGGQYWNPFPDGTITNTACNKALDAAGDNNVVMWSAHGGQNQQWKVWLFQGNIFQNSTPSWEYFIINPATGKAVDYGNSRGCNAGTTLKLHEFNGTSKQRFHFQSTGQYSKLIPDDCPDLALDVKVESCSDRATIQMWPSHGWPGPNCLSAAGWIYPYEYGMFQPNGYGCVRRIEYRVARVQWPRRPNVGAHLGVAVKKPSPVTRVFVFGRLALTRWKAVLRSPRNGLGTKAK
jgi:Ricin-type beta-trefoil lectin domain